MTNEEAINHIKYGIIDNNYPLPKEIGIEALNMAIKALEQEPCKRVDLVDRAQAQTEIEMNACRYTLAKERGGTGEVEWSDTLIKVSDAIDIIRDLPSVTPTRKKGKWICVHHIENKITYDSWKCSECQHDFNSEEESMVYFDEYKYCPNCGAEMENMESDK